MDDSDEDLVQLSLADVKLSHPYAALPRDEATLFLSQEGPLTWLPLSEDIVRIIAPIPLAQTPPEHPTVDFMNDLIDKRGIPGLRVEQVISGGWYRSRPRIAEEFVVPFRSNTQHSHGAIILVGDAAHEHTPSGGDGLNLGIQDAIMLATAIEADVASLPDTLRQYGKERQSMAKKMIKRTQWVAWMERKTRTPWRRFLVNILLRLLGFLGILSRSIAFRLSGLDS
jgi:2-polyprenyl-6-methoxyphenol hydroxylase-like FAD-dependent oxidoreductase